MHQPRGTKKSFPFNHMFEFYNKIYAGFLDNCLRIFKGTLSYSRGQQLIRKR